MPLEDIRKKLTGFYENQGEGTANINLVDLNKISSGWETEVYSFALMDDADRTDLILRTFPGTGGMKKSVYEFQLMKNLHSNDYPVPKAIHLMTSEIQLGYPFIIMERLPGGTLWKAMENAGDVEKQRLWSQFTRCFVNLHGLDWTIVVPDGSVNYVGDDFEYIEKTLKHRRRTATRYKLEEFLEVVDWLDDRMNTVPCERPSLVHYDYHPENIVLSIEGEAYVIDWSVSHVGDFRVDLGWTLLCESTYGPRELRDTILNEYQQLSETRVQNIEFFEVVAALRRLIVMAISLTGQDDVVGSRPEVDSILKGNTKHVDGVIDILKERTGISLRGFETLVREASTQVDK
ncbi:MAG: phosphotransferase family protein [Candidatus Thorarchaeota archaeon]